MKTHAALVFVFCLLHLCGCSHGPSPVSGGTAGSLTAVETRLPDFEIKIYEAANLNLLGVATTGSDGSFHLVLPKGEGPLRLSPGDYVVTLESVGPASPRMPPAYANATKTPLKVSWKSTDQSLELKIPAFK